MGRRWERPRRARNAPSGAFIVLAAKAAAGFLSETGPSGPGPPAPSPAARRPLGPLGLDAVAPALAAAFLWRSWGRADGGAVARPPPLGVGCHLTAFGLRASGRGYLSPRRARAAAGLRRRPRCRLRPAPEMLSPARQMAGKLPANGRQMGLQWPVFPVRWAVCPAPGMPVLVGAAVSAPPALRPLRVGVAAGRRGACPERPASGAWPRAAGLAAPRPAGGHGPAGHGQPPAPACASRSPGLWGAGRSPLCRCALPPVLRLARGSVARSGARKSRGGAPLWVTPPTAPLSGAMPQPSRVMICFADAPEGAPLTAYRIVLLRCMSWAR